MNSLVGYGVSSESDSDGEVEDGPAQELPAAASAATRSRYFLLEPDSASSDSEEEEQESSSPSTPASSNPPPSSSLTSNKLPPPSLNTCSDSGVFANPFRAQAEQKLSALQKHVPLTMQAKPSQIGGKRMCVSYRKDGRCRFGIKCKFAHDSDLQVTPAECHQAVSEGEEAQGSDPAEAAGGGGGSQKLQQELKEDESGGQEVKKRRVGLSNTLIPPKRAMKQYTMHRDSERLNMS